MTWGSYVHIVLNIFMPSFKDFSHVLCGAPFMLPFSFLPRNPQRINMIWSNQSHETPRISLKIYEQIHMDSLSTTTSRVGAVCWFYHLVLGFSLRIILCNDIWSHDILGLGALVPVFQQKEQQRHASKKAENEVRWTTRIEEGWAGWSLRSASAI